MADKSLTDFLGAWSRQVKELIEPTTLYLANRVDTDYMQSRELKITSINNGIRVEIFYTYNSNVTNEGYVDFIISSSDGNTEDYSGYGSNINGIAIDDSTYELDRRYNQYFPITNGVGVILNTGKENDLCSFDIIKSN